MTAVGRSIPRSESIAKVRGTAQYIHNVSLPGMLHSCIVRSEHPSGVLREVDTSGALAMQGVIAVLTAVDVERTLRHQRFGPAFHDQPVLAESCVRFAGEPVALVVAETAHVARSAAKLVRVTVDPTPGVFEPVTAATEGAPLVQEALRPGATFTDLAHLQGVAGTNVAMTSSLRLGDAHVAVQNCARVYDHTFTTQAVMHTPLEPHVVVAEVTDSGITVHSATQSPSFVRMELARMLGWPENKVRVRTAYLGGGFGAKLYMHIEPLAVVAAIVTGRPVKLSLTMEEQFTTISRHAAVIRLRTGVDEDGRLVARICDIWWNGGAYASIGPRVAQKSGVVAAGPYRFEHVAIDSRKIYTNLTPAGAMRGFGIPQVVFAYESQMDIIAEDLGTDPLAYRRQHLLREGDEHHSGTQLRSVMLLEVLDELERQMRWSELFEHGEGPLRRGRGIGIALKAVTTPSTSVATVRMSGDGSITAYCGTSDVGQGSGTAYGQIVAEVLDVDPEAVRVVHADTDVTPYDMGTLGSRSLFHMGNALTAAAEGVRTQVLEHASAQLGEPVRGLSVYDGSVLVRDGEKKLTFKEVMRGAFGMQAGNVIASAPYTPDYEKPDLETGRSRHITAFWMAAAAGVEVEVDVETGKVRILRCVTVADCGEQINPRIVVTQLTGAAVMQIGMTLSEEMEFADGQLVNAGLGNYKIPSIQDIPTKLEAVVVDSKQHNGPFGAKGVGESGTFALSPAVANAVAHATGVRVLSLPLTPKVVRAAIRERTITHAVAGDEGKGT